MINDKLRKHISMQTESGKLFYLVVLGTNASETVSNRICVLSELPTFQFGFGNSWDAYEQQSGLPARIIYHAPSLSNVALTSSDSDKPSLQERISNITQGMLDYPFSIDTSDPCIGPDFRLYKEHPPGCDDHEWTKYIIHIKMLYTSAIDSADIKAFIDDAKFVESRVPSLTDRFSLSNGKLLTPFSKSIRHVASQISCKAGMTLPCHSFNKNGDLVLGVLRLDGVAQDHLYKATIYFESPVELRKGFILKRRVSYLQPITKYEKHFESDVAEIVELL